jgi:aldehyde:ferredoxin oxidoreductase
MGGDDTLYGYSGMILRVNLSNGHIWTESTSKYARDWVGASGIAIKILYDELRPWLTPYDPVNRLIFGAGPLIGTTAPGANKISVSTLGPMTGGWASGHSDSYFGGQLRYAGYDLLVIEGRAHKPVYLYIYDDKVQIRDASRLWGKTTWETCDTIREKHSDNTLHTVSIGPAGENMARGACIIQDKGRAFGRCGIGAVMGSKNLKAITAKGTGSIKVADPKRFMEAVVTCRKMIKNAKGLDLFENYGTLSLLPGKQENCGMCYKNFQETRLPDEMAEAIDPRKSSNKYRVSQVSFPGCGIGGCSRTMFITDGPYAGLKTESSQWETFSTLQTRLAISEPTFTYKANAYCNQLGLDVDAAGGAIGWAMECFQRGIINERDTGGLKLEWGDAGVALELIRKIAYREGFGNILAEGCARAATIIGRDSNYYCLHIKSQDLYENLRASNGWALGCTTSTRGGGHTTGSVAPPSNFRMDFERAWTLFGLKPPGNPGEATEYEDKPQMVKYTEILTRMCNSLGICFYNTAWLNHEAVGLPEIVELYSAATGWETTIEDTERLGMRQLNLEKAFNLRHTDFDRKDDMPTPRDMNEPIPTGRLAGWRLDRDKWNKMLDEYYDIHGWDRKTSFPKRVTLVELGIESVADELAKIGKLY